MAFVYVLEATNGNTYVGATIDVEHRLRQHNKEITGGARATSMMVDAGFEWKCVCFVKGFPDWRSALQFEWRLKQLSRKLIHLKNKTPIWRRLYALKQLLSLERSTSKAIPYSEWSETPEIVWMVDVQKMVYDTILI